MEVDTVKKKKLASMLIATVAYCGVCLVIA